MPTSNPGILKTPSGQPLPDELGDRVEELLAAARENNMRESWECLLKLVPDFSGHTGEAAETPPTHEPDTDAGVQ